MMRDIRKRRRLNPTMRWTDNQSKLLLSAVADQVQINGVDAFEKPTAMRFYDRILQNVEEISFANWTMCKSKMRHLKKSYLQALSWYKQIGVGLLAEGNDRAVTEHMTRYCPFWELLDKIFGQTLKSMKQEEDDEDIGEEEEEELEDDVKSDPLLIAALRDEEFIRESYGEEDEDDGELNGEAAAELNGIDNSETDQTYSENDFIAFKKQFKTKPSTNAKQPTQPKTGKTCNKSASSTTTFSANSGSIALLVAMQEKKLQFEEMKWKQQQDHETQMLELEREKIKLKKLELKQQQELKRLEIERDERLAMAKMQLETESEERVKKYELELKLKNELY